MVGGADKSDTLTINTDFVKSLDLDFYHTYGDGNDNDEWRYLHPIYDDATPKRFINSWQQNGATADNLEDIIANNIKDTYTANSQIWSGTIKGDISIMDAIKVPLNLHRIYQIQRINRNIINRYNAVSMIEINPKEAYYIELAEDVSTPYYYLSSAYGDLSGSFLIGDVIYISDIRNKSTGDLVEAATQLEVQSNATYTGGRTKIETDSSMIGVSTAIEVKGVLRKA
jgi:hypothetical protein